MTIVVLGSGGRIGRLLRGLAPDGMVFQSRHPAAGVSIVGPPGEALTRHVAARKPSGLLVLWGVIDGGGPLEDNTSLALAALELACEAGVPRVVALSSAAIYCPDPAVAAFTEAQDTAHPPSPYGQAKRRAETAMREAATGIHGLQLTQLRIGNVAGADMLAASVARATAQDPLRLDRFNDGTTPRRSYASPMTLVRAAVAICETDREDLPEVMNLADSADGVAMGEMLDALAAHGSPVPYRMQPAPPNAVPRLCIDPALFATYFPLVAADFAPDAHAMTRDWLACLAGP